MSLKETIAISIIVYLVLNLVVTLGVKWVDKLYDNYKPSRLPIDTTDDGNDIGSNASNPVSVTPDVPVVHERVKIYQIHPKAGMILHHVTNYGSKDHYEFSKLVGKGFEVSAPFPLVNPSMNLAIEPPSNTKLITDK